jgi:hypothetical protein
MSYTYLLEQGEESSAECLRDIPLAAPSKSTPSAERSSCNVNATESFHGSLCGMTCEPSMERNGPAAPTWYLAASHARTSQPLAKVPESMERKADSGKKWPESSAKFDLGSCSWKTHPCLFSEDLPWSSVILPRWGIMRDGECWEQTPPDFLTVVNASGCLLPTPSGVNGGNNNTMGRVDEWGGSSNPLRGTVIGYLCSPEFEELVMGWPVTWTAPMPLETDRFRQWLRSHGRYCEADEADDETRDRSALNANVEGPADNATPQPEKGN